MRIMLKYHARYVREYKVILRYSHSKWIFREVQYVYMK